MNKKTGWIGVEDAGLLDIYVGREGGSYDGLDVTITVDAADAEDQGTASSLLVRTAFVYRVV